jgi:hypothetical protein
VEPCRIPSGDLIVIGLDPEGAEFAIAGPRRPAWLPALRVMR